MKIQKEVLSLLKKNRTISEYDAEQFILGRYKHYGLKTDQNLAIVAFRQNTSHVHYFPSPYCLRLKPNSLILIDIWARLNQPRAPFADITWMAYAGKKIPTQINHVFQTVIRARDASVRTLRKSLDQGILPRGLEVDAASRDLISNAGYGKNFLHSTGHVLGFSSPHGKGINFRGRTQSRVHAGYGYTIEPGIYLKGKFGVRSEMDCFITTQKKLVITTPLQRTLTMI